MIVEGTVIHGRAIGRDLGYPTANIDLADPAIEGGVYDSRVALDGKVYPAVTNVGTNPTVGGACRHLETHIIGFDGDLYGRRLRIELRRKIREERRFGSLDELKEQIAEDCRQVINEITTNR